MLRRFGNHSTPSITICTPGVGCWDSVCLTYRWAFPFFSHCCACAVSTHCWWYLTMICDVAWSIACLISSLDVIPYEYMMWHNLPFSKLCLNRFNAYLMLSSSPSLASLFSIPSLSQGRLWGFLNFPVRRSILSSETVGFPESHGRYASFSLYAVLGNLVSSVSYLSLSLACVIFICPFPLQSLFSCQC